MAMVTSSSSCRQGAQRESESILPGLAGASEYREEEANRNPRETVIGTVVMEPILGPSLQSNERSLIWLREGVALHG